MNKGVGVRYFLVLLPGYNESGEQLAEHPRWIDLADNTGGAIIACTFEARPKGDKSIHYAAANYGSGKALESAVEIFSHRSSKPEIKNLPFLMYGHSAGGQYAYGFSCYHPHRLIAFVSVKGGIFFPEPMEETYQVPGLIISGEKDLDRRRTAIRSLFESHRKHGAPWCWMEEKNKGHKEEACLSIAIPYVQSILDLRLENNPKQLKKIQPSAGIWLDMGAQKITPDPLEIAEKEINLGWLPGRNIYERWKNLDNGPGKYVNK